MTRIVTILILSNQQTPSTPTNSLDTQDCIPRYIEERNKKKRMKKWKFPVPGPKLKINTKVIPHILVQ